MNSTVGDKRKQRRIVLHTAAIVRSIQAPQPLIGEETTGNISLSGVYFETNQAEAYKVDDRVSVSVVVAPLDLKQFPFRRLAGRCRVVRVHELARDSAGGRRFGVALEFGQDLLALAGLPTR